MDLEDITYQQLADLLIARIDNELKQKQIVIDTLSKEILILKDKVIELQNENNKLTYNRHSSLSWTNCAFDLGKSLLRLQLGTFINIFLGKR